MNLYKALNDDYREFKLHESMTKSSRKLKPRSNNRTKLHESTEVNVSNEGNSTDVNIVIDNNKVEETPIVPEVTAPVAEEVTSEVEEPVAEDTPLEEESDKADCEGKDCEECDSKDSVQESAEDGNKFWSADFKVGDSLESDGAGSVEILDLDKGSDYILVKRSAGYQPFVAAWAPGLTEDGKLYWGQGHYFSTEDEAKSYLEDKKLSEAEKGKKVPIHNEISVEEAVEVFRQMVKDNPNNEKAKEFLRKYDPEFKESDEEVEVEEVDSKESNGPTKAAEKLDEIIKILDEEGSVDPDIVRYNISVAMEWLEPYIKDSDNEEVTEEEPLEECEVKSFNILRMSPTGNLYMIEADKVDNSRVFIVGRNFNSETSMLDEAEIFEDKDKATSKFRDILYTVNNSKKGE